MTTPDKLAAAREALQRMCDAPSSVTVYETMETVEIVSAVPVAYIRAILAALDGHAAALSAARREGAAEAFELAAKVCEDFNRGDRPPGWDAELFYECELKEDAYDAGLARGAWAGHSADAAAIRALAEREVRT